VKLLCTNMSKYWHHVLPLVCLQTLGPTSISSSHILCTNLVIVRSLSGNIAFLYFIVSKRKV